MVDVPLSPAQRPWFAARSVTRRGIEPFRPCPRHFRIAPPGISSNSTTSLFSRTTLLSQRAEPSPLWWGTSPKHRIRRGTTRISLVGCGKAKRGCASRIPPSPDPTARRTRRVLVEGATPLFWPLVRHRRGVAGARHSSPFPPPLFGVAPSTVIPAGRLKC